MTTDETAVTPAGLAILRHALGIDANHPRGTGRMFFCAETGSPDAREIERLIAAGLMRRGPHINEGRDFYAFVTYAGADKATGWTDTRKEART